MDTNLRIIELVQRRPVLYTRCNDFPLRANQWKEVADILKTDASLVKSRWHLLRARFMAEYSSVLKGNRSTFKYLSEMSFLSNHINLQAFEMYSKENENFKTEPEFDISLKDLEDASDDDSTSEFIELELDDESHRELAQIPSGASEEISQNEYVEPIYIDESSSSSQTQEEVDLSACNREKRVQVEMFKEVSVSSAAAVAAAEAMTSSPSLEDNNSAIVKEVAEDSIVEKNESEKNVSESQKACKSETTNLATTIENKSNILEKQMSSHKAENFRCEDTIFGELVTATLRQMQTDKKKTVKREIMNLLFT